MAIPVGESKYALGIIGETQARNLTSLSNRIKWEAFGDWEKAEGIFNRLTPVFLNAVDSAVYRYAKKYQQQVVIAISMGMPGWKPLAPRTVSMKRRKGYYTGIFQMRGVLVDSFVVERQPRKGVRVNVSNNNKNIQGDLNMSQILNILEHGSVRRGIPARPLLGPVWKKMGGNKKFMETIASDTFRELKIKFGI